MKLDCSTENYLMDMNIDVKKVNFPHMKNFIESQKRAKSTDYSVWSYLWWLNIQIKCYKKFQKYGSVFISFEDYLNMMYPIKKTTRK